MVFNYQWEFMEGGIESKSFNIFVVSEINGAKTYMNEDGLIGLAHYIKNLKENEKPDVFVVNGGVLPEMPINRGGERNKDKLRVIRSGVQDLEGAAAVIKPHIERLSSALPENAAFIYIMGKDDEKNLETLKLDLSRMYMDAVKKIKQKRSENIIEPKIEAIKKEIDAHKEQIKSLSESKTNIPRRIEEAANDHERESLKKELERAKLNFKINSEELDELQERKSLLELLNMQIHTELDKEKIDEMLNETNSQMTEVTRKLNEAKKAEQRTPEETEEYEKLRSDIKAIGNRQKALTKRYNEAVSRTASKELMVNSAGIHMFTGHIPLPKDVNDIVDRLAENNYRTILKNAIGRTRKVTIQEEKLSIYRNKINGFEFNVIITDGLGISSSKYKKSSNTAFVREAYVTFKGMEEEKRKIDNTPLNVLIGSRNGYSSFSMEAWENQSSTVVAALSKGPFFSVAESTKTYLNRVKTDESDGSKMLLDQSASVVQVHGDGSVAHKTLGVPLLKEERIKDDIEQAGAAEQLVKALGEGTHEKVAGHDPELERAILSSKRPSEIKDGDLAYADEKLILSLVPNAKDKMPEAAEEIKVAVITDAHVGNYGSIEMLRAAAKDALNKKVDMLVLDGDNIEGNLGNFKYVERPEANTEIMAEYVGWLKNKGLNEDEIMRAKLERYERQDKNVLSNIDSQAAVFVESVKELILDVVSRGGYVAIISGNHYNKTHRDGQHDEATMLKAHIDMLLDGFEKSGKLPDDWKTHVKTGSGSDIAAETFWFNGIEFNLRHSHPAKEHGIEAFLEAQRSGAQAVVGGHWHESKEVTTKDSVVAEGPTMQNTATNPHNKTLHIPFLSEDKLNGYLFMNMKARDGKLIETTYAPILRDQLKSSEPYWDQFLKERRMMQKVKA